MRLRFPTRAVRAMRLIKQSEALEKKVGAHATKEIESKRKAYWGNGAAAKKHELVAVTHKLRQAIILKKIAQNYHRYAKLMLAAQRKESNAFNSKRTERLLSKRIEQIKKQLGSNSSAEEIIQYLDEITTWARRIPSRRTAALILKLLPRMKRIVERTNLASK